MFEDQLYEVRLERMLKKALEADGNLDTREGSLVWYGCAPAAVEFQNLYIALDTVLKESFADTASRYYLKLRAAERGLAPYPASPAVLEMEAVPARIILPIGSRFSIKNLNYVMTRVLSEGHYELTCETPGNEGNEYSGQVIPIEYIDGLESCTITSLLVPGENEEDTEAFRQRYMDSLNAQAFGGNRTDYLEKINSLPGVGGTKVYRCWNGNISPASLRPPADAARWIASLPGDTPKPIKAWLNAVSTAGADNLLTVGGTVRIVVIDASFSTPSSSLVEKIQTAVDPLQNSGEGMGIAPIGHVVKVEGVSSFIVNVSFTPTYQDGWKWEDVSEAVSAAIRSYFTDLAKTWADEPSSLVVRLSQLESRLLGVAGILDLDNTRLNGTPKNLQIPLDQIPVLGSISA